MCIVIYDFCPQLIICNVARGGSSRWNLVILQFPITHKCYFTIMDYCSILIPFLLKSPLILSTVNSRLANTPIIRTAAKSQGKNKLQMFDWNNSRHYGVSLNEDTDSRSLTFYATDRGVGEITNKPLAVPRELLTSHQQCSRYIFLQPPDILSSPMNTKDNKLRAGTLEPRNNEGPRDWQNMFVIMRIRYIRVLFHIIILLLHLLEPWTSTDFII